MRAKLVQIGNSRGVRLPRLLIEQARLPEDVDLVVEDDTIIIAPVRRVREGWAEAAERIRAAGEDESLLGHAPTAFDKDEWQW